MTAAKGTAPRQEAEDTRFLPHPGPTLPIGNVQAPRDLETIGQRSGNDLAAIWQRSGSDLAAIWQRSAATWQRFGRDLKAI
ncbi:MAG: hypothetical protein U1A78_20590 [Polyangia bacterium]